MDLVDIIREKSFIGREFLTWLWYKSDRSGGRIELSGGRTIEVFFLDKMTLDLSESDSPQSVTIKGEQSELREGVAALKEGKKIEEARIRIKVLDNEHAVTLKGSWLAFAGLAGPPLMPTEGGEEAEDTEGRFLEKVYLVEEAIAAVDALFESFLRVRVSDDWEAAELRNIRRWIRDASV
jgi:recombination associated protein RdgC